MKTEIPVDTRTLHKLLHSAEALRRTIAADGRMLRDDKIRAFVHIRMLTTELGNLLQLKLPPGEPKKEYGYR